MLNREPVLNRAAIVSAVSALVVVAGLLGYVVSPQVQAAAVTLISFAAILAPVVTALLARRHVTPVASPQAADGTPLVPLATPPAAPERVDTAAPVVQADPGPTTP